MMRSIRLLLLLTLAAPLCADEKKPDELAALEQKLLRPLAGAHRGVAAWARSRGLMRAAVRHLMEAVTLDPQDAKARRALGYVQRGGKWILERPLEKADKVKGDQRDKLERALDQGMAPLRKKGAATYAKLATEAKKRGDAAARKRYLHRLLSYAPDEPSARAELGWVRAKGRWVRAEQAKLLEGASEGWKLPKPFPHEAALGVTLAKRKSNHVLIAGPYPDTRVARMIQIGEAAHRSFHQWLSPKAEVRSKVVALFYFSQRSQYEQMIEKYDGGDTKRKSWLKTLDFAYLKGTPLIANKPIEREDKQLDNVAYLVANALAYDICNGSALPWLLEGLSWETSLRLLGTKLHWSVTLSKSVTQFGAKNWDDHRRWRDYLRELVLLEQAPLAANVLHTKNFNEIADERAAYAWSVANWLLETAPDKLGDYCRALGKDQKSAEALQSAFGWSFAQLDAAWRQYVIDNY